MPSLILSNPLGADDAQRIGLSVREYAVGEIITVNDFAATTLIRTGYALALEGAEDVLFVGSGPPNESIGADGQWYLDELNEVLWGPKTGGLWPSDPIRPDRGISNFRISDSGGRLIVTYSTGNEVDLGQVVGEGYGGGFVQQPTDPGQPLQLAIMSRWGLRNDGTAYYNADGALPAEAALLVPDPQTGTFGLFRPGAPYANLLGDRVQALIANTSSGVYTELNARFASQAEHDAAVARIGALETADIALDGRLDTAEATLAAGTASNVNGTFVRRSSSGAIAVSRVTGLTAPTQADEAARKDWTEALRRVTSAALPAAGAAYTLALTDEGKQLYSADATATTVTIPTNAAVAFPVGSWVEFRNVGGGAVTLAGASGVTLNAPDGGLATRTTRSVIRALKTSTDGWTVFGDTNNAMATAIANAVVGATANTLAKRDNNGDIAFRQIELGAAAPTLPQHAARMDFVEGLFATAGRDRGTGTALPAADLRRGDVYYHTGLISLMVYTGSAWRQVTLSTVADLTGLNAINATHAAALHIGFRVRVADNGYEWVWNGSAWGLVGYPDGGRINATPLATGFGVGADGCSYRVRGGVCYFQFHMTRDSGTRIGTIYTFPVGARPERIEWFPVHSGGAIQAEGKVGTNGVLHLVVSPGTATGLVVSGSYPVA